MARPIHEQLDSGLAATEALHEAATAHPDIAGIDVTEMLSADPRSAVFRGIHDGRKVILKLYFGPRMAERAERHRDLLSELARHMHEGRYRVPKLLGAVPAAGAVVTEDIPGRPVADAIAEADPAERDHLLHAAGAWYAHLVRPTDRHRRGQFQAQFWARQRETGLERVAGADKTGGDPALARALATRLKAFVPALKGLPVTQVRGHGDLHTRNLLIDGDTLWGIDSENAHFLPIIKDPARLLVTQHMTAPRNGADWLGLSAADRDALLAPIDLRPAERDALLPFFVGVELADRYVNTQLTAPHGPRLMAAIRAFLQEAHPA